jgi:antitoxin (DNA-binding transcriptional repressor) of toxin-antitoxin stability system
MHTVTIEDAQSDLLGLIALAEQGEEIVIARGEKPAVRLVPVEDVPLVESPKMRVPGMFKGRVDIGPAFFEPLPPEELELWE